MTADGQRGSDGGRLVDRPTATLRPHPTYQALCGPIAATRVRRVAQQPGPIREPLLTTSAGTILDGHARWQVALDRQQPSLPCIEYDVFLICSGRPFVPSPGVLERLDLRRRLRPVAFGEQHVVVGVRVERRIEVDEIDRLVGDVPPENVQVVAVEELVGRVLRHRPRVVSRAARLRGWPSRVLRLAVPAVMCHAEARAQDARRRACRHRLKMVGPSKASPTQRHNDRGQTEPPHAITPPSRDPPRGRQIADRGGSPSFLRHPRSPNRHAHSTRNAQVLWVEMGDARRQPAPNTSTVKALRAFVGGGCLRHTSLLSLIVSTV